MGNGLEICVVLTRYQLDFKEENKNDNNRRSLLFVVLSLAVDNVLIQQTYLDRFHFSFPFNVLMKL